MSNVVQLKQPATKQNNPQMNLFTRENESSTVGIGDHDVIVREYRGKRVVTFEMIDKLHEKEDDTARKNFSRNKKHFIEGLDFHCLKGQAGRQALIDGNYRNLSELPKSNNFIFYLFTQTGYLMLAKSFQDDLAWLVQRELINGYFIREQEEPESPDTFTIMRRMIDALEQSQKTIIETAQKLDAVTEKMEELDGRTSITVHASWKQAHTIARELGLFSLSNLAHSSIISGIAKQLKFRSNTRDWTEDNKIAVVAKQEGPVTAWEVYYKPSGVDSIVNWWKVNSESAFFVERYKNKTKDHNPGDVRVSGYKIGNVKYLIKSV